MHEADRNLLQGNLASQGRCRLDADKIICAGGAVAYVEAWLNEATQSPEWTAQAEAMRQGSLF